MPEWLKPAVHQVSDTPMDVLTLRLVAAFFLGLLVAGVHHLSSGRYKAREDGSFLATLVLLPILISLVTMVIGDSANSTARAFTLVGALAIVRFRTVVDDTRDTAFVIYSVVAGMSAGCGYLVAPILCSPLVLLAGYLFRPRFKQKALYPGKLVLRLSVGKPPSEELDAVLKQHLQAYRLVSLATARGGSALDLAYAIELEAPNRAFNLVSALNKVEGVQGVEFKEDD